MWNLIDPVNRLVEVSRSAELVCVSRSAWALAWSQYFRKVLAVLVVKTALQRKSGGVTVEVNDY